MTIHHQNSTVQERVADEILQEPLQVQIGNRNYSVPTPTTATLIMLSKLIPSIPIDKIDETDNQLIVSYVLSNAQDYAFIGEFLAILILGAKRCQEKRYSKSSHWWQILRTKEKMNEKDELAQYILSETTPAEQFIILTQLIRRMQVGDFFGLITFLQGMSILAPTQEKVLKKTTVSGE